MVKEMEKGEKKKEEMEKGEKQKGARGKVQGGEEKTEKQ